MIRLIQKKHLARQFARAFVKTFDLAPKLFFDAVLKLEQAFATNPIAFHALALSSARITERHDGVNKIAQESGLPDSFRLLLQAVVQHKALTLLPFLIPALTEVYKKKHAIHDVKIASAHPLDHQHKEAIETSLRTKLPGTLVFHYSQDASLQAGIKITTPNHYWEHSLAKILKTIRHQIQEQETV